MPLNFSNENYTPGRDTECSGNFREDSVINGKIKNCNSLTQANEPAFHEFDEHENSIYAHRNNYPNINEFPVMKSGSDNKPGQVYICEDADDDSILETTALRVASESIDDVQKNRTDARNYLMMSGTIKRGKKKVQNVEFVINMSHEELEMLELDMTNKNGCCLNPRPGTGIYVFLWSMICLPFSVLASATYSFCIGTITWYNVFSLHLESKPFCCKILFPPLLIILYPFLIVSASVGVGLYAGIRQLSCCWNLWLKEFTDYEKGFYGWLCNFLNLPECSPYEVVILSSIQKL